MRECVGRCCVVWRDNEESQGRVSFAWLSLASPNYAWFLFIKSLVSST